MRKKQPAPKPWKHEHMDTVVSGEDRTNPTEMIRAADDTYVATVNAVGKDWPWHDEALNRVHIALIVRAVNRDHHFTTVMEALSGLIDATANVIDVGSAYDQAVRVLKAAEEATG